MGRKNKRAPQPDRPEGPRSLETLEEHPDGEWYVRRITGSSSTKPYRCPGCDQEIRPATPHVVAWPAEDPKGLEDRRHWHSPCWAARNRRRAK